jgi:hypothetical protein
MIKVNGLISIESAKLVAEKNMFFGKSQRDKTIRKIAVFSGNIVREK